MTDAFKDMLDVWRRNVAYHDGLASGSHGHAEWHKAKARLMAKVGEALSEFSADAVNIDEALSYHARAARVASHIVALIEKEGA